MPDDDAALCYGFTEVVRTPGEIAVGMADLFEGRCMPDEYVFPVGWPACCSEGWRLMGDVATSECDRICDCDRASSCQTVFEHQMAM